MHLLERLFTPLFLFDADGGGGDGGGEPAKTEPAKTEPAKTEPAKTEPAKTEPQKPPWGDAKDFDPERAWNLITGIRSDLDKVKSERDEYKGKVEKHENASKSDQQRLEDRATGAEKERDEAKADAARLRVALKKGLTETQARRLVGGDEEALEKDADELLASFKEEGDGQEPPARRPRERLRPGAAPSSEPEDDDPTKLAEQVSRGY